MVVHPAIVVMLLAFHSGMALGWYLHGDDLRFLALAFALAAVASRVSKRFGIYAAPKKD